MFSFQMPCQTVEQVLRMRTGFHQAPKSSVTWKYILLLVFDVILLGDNGSCIKLRWRITLENAP